MKKIGILTTDENEPIQENLAITMNGYLDITLTNNIYKAYLTEHEIIMGSWAELQYLSGLLLAGDLKNSCKKILEANPALTWTDWIYLISLQGAQKVYCDMTDKWGGWTRYVDIKGNYSFEEAKKCWFGNHRSTTIDCFNPNQYSFIAKQFKATINGAAYYKQFTKDIPSKIYKKNFSDSYCRWGGEYMTAMKQDNYPNADLDNIDYIWLGLSFCDIGFWWVGWTQSTGNPYMNSASITKQWPYTGTANWENTADETQLYIR